MSQKQRNTSYEFDDIKIWAAEYKKYQSFTETAKIVGANRDTVRKWLNFYKEDLWLIFKSDFYGLETETTKTCSKCHLEKEKTEFTGNGQKLRPECNDCINKRRSPHVFEEQERIKSGFKTCTGDSGCGEIKALSEFFKCSKSTSGYDYSCKECVLANKNTNEIRIANNLRTRIRCAIKNNQKVGSAISDLGCSIEFLKRYLGQKFYVNRDTGEMMSWENYGADRWHIDHIKPLASFDLENREEFLKACHYTNLQPLWAKENLSKGCKINWEQK